MQERVRPPKDLSGFKAKPPRVEVTREPTDEADVVVTKAMLDQYTQPDGFHCPRCGVVITDIEEAVNHLAEEINKSLAQLGK